MYKTWDVNISRLIGLLSSRMYSNVLYSGLKELITNSLDAKRGDKVRIQIFLSPGSIRYKDDGIGIAPNEFDKKFGEIASDHEREDNARGFFGIGRLGLLSQAKEGSIYSYSGKKMYIWKFTSEGYSEPEEIDREGNGIVLMYTGLKLEYDKTDLCAYLAKTFAIPLLQNECTIDINNVSLISLINDKYTKIDIPFQNSKIRVWYAPQSNGKKYISHKGIGVMEEDYTGLVCFVDEEVLNIKTDREGFINDKVYKEFRQILSNKLSELRPEIELQRMQIDFIQRLMVEFKKYWVKKKASSNVGTNTIGPVNEQISNEVKPPVLNGKERVEETNIELKDLPLPSIGMELEFPDQIPIVKEDEKIEGEKIEGSLQEQTKTILETTTTPDGTKALDLGTPAAPEPEPVKEDSKAVVHIRGAKPMDLGPNFPMIFFEKDPFIMIFNTSHPTFKKLVERGNLSSDKLAVLFERMFECAVISQDGEDLEQVKIRWTEVDKNLEKIFK